MRIRVRNTVRIPVYVSLTAHILYRTEWRGRTECPRIASAQVSGLCPRSQVGQLSELCCPVVSHGHHPGGAALARTLSQSLEHPQVSYASQLVAGY